MSKSANVLSVDTLKDFKVSMINFGEDARNALSGVDMELRRMRDWLERDQLGFWQAQVKKRSEEMMQARADLHRRKISQQGSDAVSDAEQKEALREATKRLRVAEEKVQIVRKLIPFLHHAIDEYHSHSQPLGDHLSGGFEKSVLGLERMIVSLESYLALRAPAAPRLDSAQNTGPAAATGGSSTTGDPASATTSSEAPAGETTATDGAKANPAVAAGNVAPAGENLVSGRVS
jgi:hypothetical protein